MQQCGKIMEHEIQKIYINIEEIFPVRYIPVLFSWEYIGHLFYFYVSV